MSEAYPKFCCKELAENFTSRLVVYEDGQWHVPGCCGGGCWTLTNIRCCPFCGTTLNPKGP